MSKVFILFVLVSTIMVPSLCSMNKESLKSWQKRGDIKIHKKLQVQPRETPFAQKEPNNRGVFALEPIKVEFFQKSTNSTSQKIPFKKLERRTFGFCFLSNHFGFGKGNQLSSERAL